MLHRSVSVVIAAGICVEELSTESLSLIIGEREVSGKLDLGHRGTVLEEVSTDYIDVIGVCKCNIGKSCAVCKCVVTKSGGHYVTLSGVRPNSGGNGCRRRNGNIVKLLTSVECIIADRGDAGDDAYGCELLTVVEGEGSDLTILCKEGEAGDLAVSECAGSDLIYAGRKRCNACRNIGRIVVKNGHISAVNRAVLVNGKLCIIGIDSESSNAGTACIGVTVKSVDSRRNVTVGDLVTRAECKCAEVLNTEGEREIGDVVAIEECIVTEVGDAGNYYKLGDVVTVCERIVANRVKIAERAEVLGDDTTVLEYMTADEGKAGRKVNLAKGGGILEDVVLSGLGGTEISDVAALCKLESLHCGAVLKRGGTDAQYSRRNGEALKRGVVVERLNTDGSKIVANLYSLKAGTALKRLIGNSKNIGDADFLKAGAVSEGVGVGVSSAAPIVRHYIKLNKSIRKVDALKLDTAVERSAAKGSKLAVVSEGHLSKSGVGYG